MDENTDEGVCFKQPKTLQQRCALAKQFCDDFLNDPSRQDIVLLVDDMDNTVELAFEARPEKLVAVRNGLVVFHTGIGPYQYSVGQLERWLAQEFRDKAA